jgi:cell surface protein SprA
MGHQPNEANNIELNNELMQYQARVQNTLPVDSPTDPVDPDDLPYTFKDNQGKPPQYNPKSKLYLEDPNNIKTDVEYDQENKRYEVSQKVGDKIDYRPDTWMSQKEYENYAFKKAIRDYWRSRVAADEMNSPVRKSMVPKLEVNSDLFDRIFGGNTVDIKPTGTAELIFGLQRNKTLNPAIPQRQQKITNFDFNMRIQLNLIGKIGDKMKITTNYNTEASFDWENQIKLDYTGYEDEIIKKIEAGNVTMPLNSSLITGSQTLFGFKTKLQFGRLDVTTVFSQQRGKKQEINVQGGAQTQAFTVNCDNYETNKHFYLGHFFRKNYDAWMNTLPVISTPIVITKVEVYILNQTGSAEQTRNVVAFEDLGEDKYDVYPGLRLDTLLGTSITSGYAISDSAGVNPSNGANSLYGIMTNPSSGLLSSRNASLVANTLPVSSPVTNSNNPTGQYMVQARDYDIIYNARRLNPQEFFINNRTGFISLNQTLNNDQVLAVSYQYTYNGKLYQVGEFSEQFPDNTKLLVCKLLKGSVVNTRFPLWKLMMKNVYSIGAFNVNPTDFMLGIYYNNIETGVDVPYIPSGKINGIQLIRVLNCDKLSVNGDRIPDGVFDFIKDFTINPNNGRIYLPMAEPFGNGLRGKFDPDNDFPAANKYIFQELYDSTRTSATFIQEKNRYKIKGTFKSAAGSEISLNALNIPQGAVLVTANGVPLTENADYTVDYTLGRVKIINESLLNSGANIKVSLESNSLFNVQQKSLIGTRLDFKASRNLTLGSTIMRFSERPITQKVSLGDEPVKNTVVGLDYNYKTELPFLTRWLDKLPVYSTKEMSSLTTRGEVAKLFPGNAKAIGKSGNSYIDDFEGSISLIDIRSPYAWMLSSIPQNQASKFLEASQSSTITPGLNRARFNWYTIDAMFTRTQGQNTTPTYYNNDIFSNNMWRQVFETELFPGKTPPNGQQVVLPVLDLGFWPSERGPYNYDVKPTSFSKGIDANGLLLNPETRWGGIMRRLETNDFQAANIEYVQFWLMDPFNEDYDVKTDPNFDKTQYPEGDLYINLGNISEDIVKDGRMSYENGLPGPEGSITSNLPVNETGIAVVPAIPPTVNAFSSDNNDRPSQDIGYDGMNNSLEITTFSAALADMQAVGNGSAAAVQKFLADPSSDDYNFFRDDDYDAAQEKTIVRYSKYNNPEGNSPTEAQYNNANPNGGNYSTAASNQPNIEDVNRDNTLSETESYYQYRVRISKSDVNPNAVGTNYIVDAFDGSADFGGIKKTVKWYQFKIPINQFEGAYGGIEGFNSIRFMRVYMRGFARPVLLRMARFELVRSDWRRYAYDLKKPGEYIKTDDNSTVFDVSAVSLQENGTKVPVNYVMPPGIQQQQNIQTTNLVLQNEQALQIRVCNLKDGDSRGVFKNVDLDTRMFKNIKMNVHAEAMSGIPLNDDDLHLFVRVGSDYNNNYYEYELPLKLTPKGAYDPNSTDSRALVWPAANEVNIKFDEISLAKDARNTKYGYFSDLNKLSEPFTYTDGLSGYSITVVGNPNLGNVKSIMVGVRNPKGPDNLAHCVEVWVNELRLTDFNNQGGWAATGQMQLKLADLGNASLAGTYYSPFYGSVEQKINERRKESTFIWDGSASINAGKFFPTNWKITLPVYYNYGRTIITPLFNPIDPDVRMSAFKENDNISDEKKSQILDQVLDFTERKGFNLTNVRVDGFKRKGAKPMPWDISNFSVTYAYTETDKRNINIETNIVKQYRGNLTYQYSIPKPPVLKPFAKMKVFQNKWFALIKDFNLQLMPNSFGAGVDVNRNFSVLKNRDITSFYAGAQEFQNPSLYNKNFLINRNYNMRWDISKSLKFDFAANNEGRIFEPTGEVGKLYQEKRDSIINTFLDGTKTVYGTGTGDPAKTYTVNEGRFGANLNYRQQMNLNFSVPLNKFPLLDFITVNYKFGGTYTWSRAPFGTPTDSMFIGNTINNTNQHNITGSLAMNTFYNKIPYFKRINTGQNNKNPVKMPSASKSSTIALTDSTNPKKNENFKDIAEFLARAVMMVKNISLTYQDQKGQGLPNFLPQSQFMGMDDQYKQYAPGFRFTTGLYDPTIRETSAKNGWLAKVPNQTTPYIETETKSVTYRASVEPHGSFKIELTGNYSKSKSLTEYLMYDTVNNRPYRNTYDYNFHQSTNETGNFNISTFSFFQSLKDAKPNVESVLFDEFKLDRDNVANELADANPNSIRNSSSALGTYTALQGTTTVTYRDGYSDNQQDVLIGAFYRTYTGRGIKNYSTTNIFPNIPLPNWTITWDGLGKIKGLQKTFRSITLRHGYRSTYNIAGYSNNLLYGADENDKQYLRSPVADPVTGNANFNPKYTINAVTITEGFTPLLKIDLQFQKPGWQANAEMKRDKTISLNITGPQIIETKGQEYIVGLGYRYPNLAIKGISIGGKPLKSDLTVKVDFSYRRNLSIIRRIADDISVPTGGTNIITLRSSADYLLTPNINLRLYLDWIRTKPQTSASFPTANTSGGFSLRINFQ